MSFVISVDHLNYFRGERQILKDICFEWRSGELIALLGPNGSGKSTLMGHMAQLLQGGQDAPVRPQSLVLKGLPLGQQLTVGWLPEVRPLYPSLTLGEYLEYVVQLRTPLTLPQRSQRLRESMDKVIEQLKLGALVSLPLGHLSQGQQQRASLAQALLHHPQVLLLDEPTNGLDLESVQELEVFLQQQRGEGSLVVFSTHHLAQVKALADRVMVMKEGRGYYFTSWQAWEEWSGSNKDS